MQVRGGSEDGGSALPFDDLHAPRSEPTDPRSDTDYWKEQIRLQIKLMKKAEQQAFAGKGLDFVTTEYNLQEVGDDGRDIKRSWAVARMRKMKINMLWLCLGEIFMTTYRKTCYAAHARNVIHNSVVSLKKRNAYTPMVQEGKI